MKLPFICAEKPEICPQCGEHRKGFCEFHGNTEQNGALLKVYSCLNCGAVFQVVKYVWSVS